MYKRIIRPIFFSFYPETIHKLVFLFLKAIQLLGINYILNLINNRSSLQMETFMCGIKFPNKVGVAAGLDKNAEVYNSLGSLGFGHVEIGTITPKPQPGNTKPRSFRLTADNAIINRMGFNNCGLDEAIKRLKKRPKGIIVGGNIGKNTITPNNEAVNDYLTCFRGLYEYVDYITVNVSCPNVTDLQKLQDQEQLETILRALTNERLSRLNYKPIFLKISPDLNLAQIDQTIYVVENCGIDGIIACNTSISRDGLKTKTDVLTRISNGGISGEPLKQKSNDIIKYITQKTNGKLPIIGVGGVFNVNDAIDKINAGAWIIQVYTGFIYEGPAIANRINKGLKNYICKLHK